MCEQTPVTGAGARPYLTCRQVVDFIMAYLEGELDADARREFERHLHVCPSCVNYLASYRRTVELGKVAMADSEDDATGTVPEALLRAIRRARDAAR